jgi:hypothetical protein
MGFELSWSLIAALHGNKHCIDCAHDARRALTGYAFAVWSVTDASSTNAHNSVSLKRAVGTCAAHIAPYKG